MPALLLGYETHRNPPWGETEPPRWLVHVEQQAGGGVMSYPSAHGVLLRLEANADLALRDPAPLIAAFHAMAEDPRPGEVARLEPRLLAACDTRGEPLPPSTLDGLSDALTRYFDLPRCLGGLEAFVRLDDAPTCVLGWRRVVPARGVAGIGEEWPGGSSKWADGSPLEPYDLETLERACRAALRVASPPSLFLLWENSD